MKFYFFPPLFCSLTIAMLPSLFATDANWANNANVNWNVNGNWAYITGSTFPNAVGDQANFGTIITANRTITLGQNITVGTITIDSTHNYMISGANTLTFQMGSGNANLTIASTNTGAPSINAATSVNLASTLSINNSGSGNFTISGAMSGNGGLITTGTGTGSVILNNANTYLGTTQIKQGVVTYNVDACIPSASSVTIGDGITSGVQLAIAANMSSTSAFPLMIQSDGELLVSNNRTAYINTLDGSGTVSLPSGTTTANLFEVFGSLNPFSGTITGGNTSGSSNPTTNNRFIKSGASTLTLSGTSDYVSRTFISQGTISVQNENALGASGADSAVYVQATGTQGTLELDGSGLNLPKTLFLNGPGFANGALYNTGGNNTVSGNVQIGWSGGPESASDVTIAIDPTFSLVLTGLISGSNNLTLTGGGSAEYLSSVTNTLSGTTTITDSTTLLLDGSGGNTLSGPVNVQSGFLILEAANQISDTVTVTLSGGTFNMQGFTDTIGSLVFNSGTLLQGGAVLTLSDAIATTLSMSDGTSITGDLAFIAAGGVSFTGSTGTASISGDINLNSFAHAFNIAASTASPSMNISGSISGTGSITKSTGTGVLEFSGTTANTYSGTTTVSAGTLFLDKTAGINAIAGNVTLNTGGTLSLGASEQISDASTMTLSGGTFNMGMFSETISELIMTSGTLSQTGSSVLSLASNTTALSMTGVTISGSIALTGTGGVTTNSSPTTSTIGGTLDLGTASHTFTTAHNGAASPDVNISATIIGNGGGFTKAGVAASVLSLTNSAPNTYTGLTTVSNGTLLLNASVGPAIPGAVTVSGGTLQSAAAGQIASTSIMTISGGTWTMGGFSQTLDQLIFQSGTLTPGGATLTLSDPATALTMRNVNLTAPIIISGGGAIVFDATSNGTANINNTVDLGGFTVDFNIGAGTATEDMAVSGVISDGAVTLIGPGQLNFTVANSYTGLTTISNGTLRLGTGANTFAIPGDILINGGTLLTSANNQMTHTSSVTLSSGAMTMTAGNQTINDLTYTGGALTATTSTLTLESSATALTMQNVTITGGTVLLNGTTGGDVVFDNTSNGTATLNCNVNLGTQTHNFNIADGTASTDMAITGVISGTGAITKIGAGTLAFEGSASNTYGGLTTVSAGTLLLAQTAGNAIAGNVLINGGDLMLGNANQIANTSTVTLSSGTFDLSGFAERINTFDFYGGTFSQEGGILSLTTLTMRDTTISGGILMEAGGGIFFDDTNNGTATISGSIDFNGTTTTFDITDGTSAVDMSITGVISNGTLIKGGVGTGTLSLTGANTYAGGTTVNTGVLQGDTTGLQGTITNNATLDFNQAGTGTFTGTFNNLSTLIFEGGGSFTLNTTNSSTGTTTVSSSTLIVDSVFNGAGNMTIGPGATLMGTGPITQNITVQGTLAPGNSIGTILLTGAQTLASGSTLANELNPTITDLVEITGSLTIDPGATLKIIPDVGVYNAGKIYTIATTTAGRSGEFSFLQITLPSFGGKVIYDPNSILFEISFVPFSVLVPKGNAGKVARCLDAISPPDSTDLGFVVSAIRMLPTIEDIKSAFEQMQPSIFTSLSLAEQDNALMMENAIFNRLQTDITGWNLWLTPLGSYTTNDHQQQEPGFRSATGGVILGCDRAIGANFCVGAGIAYTHTNLSWQSHSGKAVFESFYGALYTQWNAGGGFINAAFLQSLDLYKTNRNIDFGTAFVINRKARSYHGGFGSSLSLEGAYEFFYNNAQFFPFLRTAYLFVHEGSFKEHGAQSLDLEVWKKNSDLFFTELGFFAAYAFSLTAKTVTPFIELGIERDQRFYGRREHATFDGVCTLDVKGLYPSRTLFNGSAGISFANRGKQPFLSIAYNGRFAPHFSDQSIYCHFLVSF